MSSTKAVRMGLLHHDARREPLAELSRFRGESYSCLTARSDALFELADAVLRGDGTVRSLAELSLVGEHRRGHGGLYAAPTRGQVDAGRMRQALASVPLPRAADGRLVLAVDVTCWLRPDAHTSPQRILCRTYGRGKDQHIPVPGWPYSIVCALEPGRGSWTAPLDVLRSRSWRRHRNRHRPTVARTGRAADRRRSVGEWRPGSSRHRGRRIRRTPPRLPAEGSAKDLPVQALARMRRSPRRRRRAGRRSAS